MSFGDIANRFKKHAEEQVVQPEKEMDYNELYTLRGRIVGVLIRDARVAKGYTAEHLAGILQVDTDTIIAWEFGNASPSLPQLELMAYALEVPVSHFFGATNTLVDQMAARNVDQNDYIRARDGMIGTLIRMAQQQANFTTEYLAEQCGLEVALLTEYQYGRIPVPLTHLTSIARALRVNISFFMDDGNRVGTFLEAQELFNTFLEMDSELRQFLTKPSNHRYIELAMKMAEMDIEKLRLIAENLLEITY